MDAGVIAAFLGTIDCYVMGSRTYEVALGKQVVRLLYPGEGHGLTRKENQVDYERILQWFGHSLKGEPAASWITEGQKAVDRRLILDVNK